MSKILNLARDFNSQSKKQANAIEQTLKQDFERHEQRIQDALKASEQKITNDIQDQQSRLNLLVMKTWIWLPIMVITVLIACWGVIWWQGMTIAQNQQEISRQQSTLKALSAKGGNIQMSTCGDQNQLCIKIDLDETSYGANGVYPWKIPEGY
ncbi:MbeB family mobilization protein [Vibrio harveyi]|uniref:Putative mobilization protein mobB n=1 Tax=Vibrio harveyi TaxID=669 RepID=S5FKI4_VIBHA|nr:putative mobilization protein mobB [Vibrio harveyi]AGW25578.1 putative mobilization protein mobB [Vibrio harveyi]